MNKKYQEEPTEAFQLTTRRMFFLLSREDQRQVAWLVARLYKARHYRHGVCRPCVNAPPDCTILKCPNLCLEWP